MEKTICKTVIIAFVSILTLSCSKDTDTPIPSFQEENFLEGYLIATGFNQKNTDFVNSGTYEVGLEFTPLVKGSITSLKVKLPDANPALRVTIWDKLAGTIVRTEIVNVALANTVYNLDIIDIPLLKDKEYAITMNSGDYYFREKTDGSDATYPVSVGNIKINQYVFNAGSTQAYPSNLTAAYYSGDFSFNFLQQL